MKFAVNPTKHLLTRTVYPLGEFFCTGLVFFVSWFGTETSLGSQEVTLRLIREYLLLWPIIFTRKLHAPGQRFNQQQNK